MQEAVSALQTVFEQIFRAAEKSGRDTDSVKLVGASKKKDAALIRNFRRSGLKDFGENYVQEFLGKHSDLVEEDINWHFFGHLQRNKVKYIIDKVDMIQSLDSVRLAKKIQKEAEKKERSSVDVLIQVNVGKEDQKSGIMPSELPELISEIKNLKNLNLRGLMSLPPFLEPEELRPYHRRLRELRDRMLTEMKLDSGIFCELSMGMSRDFAVAVEEGATIVRVGTLLFGER
ncbi:MAG: YggS family pyridoxal phosphate-dependent enzyme [bacterium]